MQGKKSKLWWSGPLALTFVLCVSGCVEHRTVRTNGYADEWHRASGDLEGRQTALLFDRIPGEPRATAFNDRSNWPSEHKARRGGEKRYYATYFNDYQGYGFYNFGHVHRSARYYRVGWEER